MENKKAGRPKLNEEFKKQLVSVRLLPANIQFYNINGKAKLINDLLNKAREDSKNS
jgi:uncharacterized protein (DUF4415 family)